MVSLHMDSKKTELIRTESRLVVASVRMCDGGQGTTSSYKMSKFWGCKVQPSRYLRQKEGGGGVWEHKGGR